MTLSTGTRLGPYEIVAPLGAGGMGQVYRARDTRLDRTVAIKVLPDHLAADPQFRERFEREAKTISQLNHPHVCTLHDVGEANGLHFLVMECVEGPTLADQLVAGPLPVVRALAAAVQIADALDAAHQQGIVHRDLKPANVKFSADGSVKVLDFGLAKGGGGAGGLAALSMSPTVVGGTLAGVILGTAAYMSPEQARGLPVDKRTDIWAFGCVLYEMLTGRQAFQGGTVTDIIAAIVTREPDWTLLPPDLPANIRRLVQRCLQKEPKQRLHDIADARIELADVSSEDMVAPAVAPQAPTRSRQWWPAIAAATIALAIGVAGGRVWRASPTVTEQWIGTRLGGPATVDGPRVSPDGQLVAFLTVVDGQSQVGVMKPASGNWTVLTHDRAHGLANSLFWSPDGTRLYYDRVTDAPQGIYSVPALGGEERLVLEHAISPSALPDGTLLVKRINTKRELQYFRFSPATGSLNALPAITPLTENELHPMPNGREAVFFGRPEAGGDFGLYVLDLASGRAQRIAHDIGIDATARLSRLPLTAGADGSILFGTQRGDAFDVFRLGPNRAEPSRQTLSFHILPFVDLARDGTLYVSLQDRPVEAVWANARGGPPEHVATSPMFVYGGLAPLPDGRALMTARAAGRSRVLVVGAGRDPNSFLETDEETSAPMTAIGKDNAAVAIGTGSSREIAVASISSGRVIRRLRGGIAAATTLSASPDGRTLYYSASGSIWALPIEGGTERKVCAGDSVAVDPDSGDLIVKLDEPQHFRLLRVPPAGGSVRELPMGTDLRMALRPLSSGAVRDGRLLFSAATDDSWFWFVGMLDLKTGAVTKVPVQYEADVHLVAWTPDGKIIAMALGFRSTLWRYQPSR